MPLDTPANPVWHNQLDDGDPSHYVSNHNLKLLAEGDSWFSLNAFPGSNLLDCLKFDKSNIIVNCANPGDPLRTMVNVRDNDTFKLEIEGGVVWNAILLSGGGNDLIDDLGNILPPSATMQPKRANPADYCDAASLAATLDSVVQCYQTIFSWRDGPKSKCPNAPSVIHTYDRATPRDSAARFIGAFPVRGPWLKPALERAGVPPAKWNAVSDFLMGALGDRLLTLPTLAANIHVIDTRGTLARADPGTEKNSQDWLNEIHPNKGGYKKLSNLISPILAGLLP